jgi:hypothetical protein
MKKYHKILVLILTLALTLSTEGIINVRAFSNPAAITLGSASNFAILAGSAVTGTGTDVVTGDAGLSPSTGAAITLLTCAEMSGASKIYDVDAAYVGGGGGSTSCLSADHALASTAKTDLALAYADGASAITHPVDSTIPTDLIGQVLTTGVYDSASGTFSNSGTLTLDAEGDPTRVFIFKMATTLITSSSSHVVLINGAKASNVFWVVGSSATLGSSSDLVGTIMAQASITLNTSASVVGRLLADANNDTTGAVTLDGANTVTLDTTVPTVTIADDEVGTANSAGGNVVYTFTFSETVTGFVIGDITVAGGTKGLFTPVSGTVYTLVVTPSVMEGNMTVDVAGSMAIDAAGNGNTAATQSVQAVDTIAPTVTSIVFSDSALTIGDTPTVTIVMSEAVASFTTVDVTTPNGTLGALSTVDNITFTGTFTPNVIEDTSNIAVVGTGFTDIAGNPGSAGASSANYTIATVEAQSSNQSSGTGTINVVKIVINDNGGTKTVADFPLFISGTPVSSGVTNTFSAGSTYTVYETADPHYTATFSGACDSDGRVRLSYGDQAFCVLTNDDVGEAAAVLPVPPLIDVVKVPSPLVLPDGPGSVEYTYTLINIGSVPVTDITMVGDTCSPIHLISGDTDSDEQLDVNETWIYTCTTTLTETHTNTVVTTGWANGLSAVDIASATVVVGEDLVPPLIHVTSVPVPLTLPLGGGMVTYTETVSNPGTVSLGNIIVTSDNCAPVNYVSGDTNGNSLLDSTESWIHTCRTNLTSTASHTVTVSSNTNSLVSRDYAIATVLVANAGVTGVSSVIPGLPDTGFAPKETGFVWAFIVAGLLAALRLLMVLA